MNQRRVVGILQELATAHERVASLQRELSEAMAEDPKRKPRARKHLEPVTAPSEAAVNDVRRQLRAQGVRV